jgi:hypothetical protein
VVEPFPLLAQLIDQPARKLPEEAPMYGIYDLMGWRRGVRTRTPRPTDFG